MIKGIERAVTEAIQDEVSARLHDLNFTLKDAVRQVYWKSYEKGKVPEKVLTDLDNLIDGVFQTVHRQGPEDESWPAFDKDRVNPIIEQIQDALGLEK